MTDKQTISDVMAKFASMGGKARAEKLTKEELSRQGKKAAKARWAGHSKKAAKKGGATR